MVSYILIYFHKNAHLCPVLISEPAKMRGVTQANSLVSSYSITSAYIFDQIGPAIKLIGRLKCEPGEQCIDQQ